MSPRFLVDRRGESLLFVRDANMLEIWERVCCQAKAKENGGLGVTNLRDQNHCLLLKFVHKLHDLGKLVVDTFPALSSDCINPLGRANTFL